MRNPWAGKVFDTLDEVIAKALLDVSIPTLMMSLVHISGDPELIRGDLKPAGLFLNEVQGFMSEEDKARVRAIALDLIRGYRDPGCPEPKPIFYCYSFEPSSCWTEFFPQQPERQAYFQRVMERHDIERHVRFDTEVLDATRRAFMPIRRHGR